MTHWAIHAVASDWEKNPPKKRHNTLPASYTSPILREIRMMACLSELPDQGCAKWGKQRPVSPGPREWWKEEEQGPYAKTQDYVCGDCNNPIVSNLQLQKRLLNKDNDLKENHKTFRRYLNGEVDMWPSTFRTIVAHAFAERWLNIYQTGDCFTKTDELEAAKLALIQLCKRAGNKPAAFMATPRVEILAALNMELSKQSAIIEEAALDKVKRRKGTPLPKDFRAVLEEWLADQSVQDEAGK